MQFREFTLRRPGWVADYLGEGPTRGAGTEERMGWVIGLARRNVAEGTGGPFGAAVCEQGTGRVIAVGVNVVEQSGCALAHAEMLALGLAQRELGTYDLGKAGAYELVSSVEPCAMCLGAVCWSGVRRLVCGGRDEDARAIGFDEGPKLTDWPGELEKRGIAVEREVLRVEAAAVLREYAERGGLIYNGRGAMRGAHEQ